MKHSQIEITTEFIKLDSFLKLSGLAESGAGAKIMIQSGVVAVDGEICIQRGKKLRPGNKVEVENQILEVVASAG